MMSYLVIFSFVILRASSFPMLMRIWFIKKAGGGRMILERNTGLLEISFVFLLPHDCAIR